jgi:hypothetical protein
MDMNKPGAQVLAGIVTGLLATAALMLLCYLLSWVHWKLGYLPG